MNPSPSTRASRTMTHPTRGFGVAETVELTGWMCDVLESLENGTSEAVIAEVKGKVLEICKRFPVYG